MLTLLQKTVNQTVVSGGLVVRKLTTSRARAGILGLIFAALTPLYAEAGSIPDLGSLISDAATAVGGKMVELISGAIGSILEGIAHIVFNGAGIFMAMMGSILDTSINFTVQSAVFKNIGAIQVGWTAVRDFSNMFFIFVLLYIAILTVLGMAGSNAKRWVAHLVVAALLINFSLFATQVVVDAGNVLAVGFWDKMTMTVNTSTGPITKPTAALFFMEGFRIQTTADSNGNAMDPSAKPIESNHTKMILIYVGGTLVYLVAGYVFLAGAVMMVIRSVTLMILMIVSPFAFLGFALPKGGGFANQWLNKLIGSTFVAPAFIFMLYIDSLIIRGTTAAGSEWMKGTSADKAKFALAFGGNADNFAIVYNFVLMLILLLAALKVADAVSSGAGSAAGSWAKKGLGGGAAAGFTGIAAFGRQTYGAAGKRAMNDDKWVKSQQQLVAKGGMAGRVANMRLATAEKASKGTFDIRNAPMGGLGVAAGLGAAGIKAGTASKKTYETTGQVGSSMTGNYRGTAKEKELIDQAKDRYSKDPAAQKAFLEQRGVQLDAYRNKDVKSDINRKIATKADKDSIESNISAAERADMSTAEGRAIGEAAAEAIKKSMANLSGKEAEDIIKKSAATVDKDGNVTQGNQLVMQSLGRQHLTHMNSNPAEFSPDVLTKANNAVMLAGGPGASYLIQQAKMKTGVFPTNLQEELEKRQASYITDKNELNLLPDTTLELAKQKREALAAFEEKHDNAVQDVLGGMSIKEIARLKNSVKSDETLVRNYTDKHFDEIENYHKKIAKDTDVPATKSMLENIRKNAEEGKPSSQKYMSKAKTKRDSVYFDPNAISANKTVEDAKKVFEQTKQSRVNAEAKLAEAKTEGVIWRRNDAQQKLVESQKAEQVSKDEFDRLSKESKDNNTSNTGGAVDDDENDV